jgi:hypothetical protein
LGASNVNSRDGFTRAGNNSLRLELNDQERQAVGRALAERKARASSRWRETRRKLLTFAGRVCLSQHSSDRS